MPEPRFQVVFAGALTDEYDLATTKKRFARLLRLDPSKTERLFSGKSYVLKSGVDETTAMKYAIAIANAGGECDIMMMLEPAEETLMDRRRGERRIGRDDGASHSSDRREAEGRRKSDRAASTGR